MDLITMSKPSQTLYVFIKPKTIYYCLYYQLCQNLTLNAYRLT